MSIYVSSGQTEQVIAWGHCLSSGPLPQLGATVSARGHCLSSGPLSQLGATVSARGHCLSSGPMTLLHSDDTLVWTPLNTMISRVQETATTPWSETPQQGEDKEVDVGALAGPFSPGSAPWT